MSFKVFPFGISDHQSVSVTPSLAGRLVHVHCFFLGGSSLKRSKKEERKKGNVDELFFFSLSLSLSLAAVHSPLLWLVLSLLTTADPFCSCSCRVFSAFLLPQTPSWRLARSRVLLQNQCACIVSEEDSSGAKEEKKNSLARSLARIAIYFCIAGFPRQSKNLCRRFPPATFFSS